MYIEFLVKKEAIEKSWDLKLYEYNLLKFFKKGFDLKVKLDNRSALID